MATNGSTLEYAYHPPTQSGQAEEEDEPTLTCCQSLRFFVKQSCKDIGRHKCQFALSFCSVFVVVLAILVVSTITSMGPIIFLRLSQKYVGEYDGIFYNNYHNPVPTFSEFYDDGYYLNYTEAKIRFAETGVVDSLSPRQQFQDTTFLFGQSGSASLYLGLIDTAKEKSINLGVEYPFEPLGPGECIFPNNFAFPNIPDANLAIQLDQSIEVQWNAGKLLASLVSEFNNRTDPAQHVIVPPTKIQVIFNCTVKGFLDTSYGKYEQD